LRIFLLWVDRTKNSWIDEGIKHYLKRLNHYLDIQILEVKTSRHKTANPSQAVKLEAKAILKAIPHKTFLVALDSRGKQMDSPELATFITDLEDKGIRNLTMVIGGPYGLDREITKACNMTLSLSRMTFTHDMTRVILLEQLYRACTIKAGVPYHH